MYALWYELKCAKFNSIPSSIFVRYCLWHWMIYFTDFNYVAVWLIIFIAKNVSSNSFPMCGTVNSELVLTHSLCDLIPLKRLIYNRYLYNLQNANKWINYWLHCNRYLLCLCKLISKNRSRDRRTMDFRLNTLNYRKSFRAKILDFEFMMQAKNLLDQSSVRKNWGRLFFHNPA